MRGLIMQKIQEQVKDLILQARKDSENKVKSELKIIGEAMKEMDSKLDLIVADLDSVDQEGDSGEPTAANSVENTAVLQALAKVEAHWGKELGKLKQELHQTIFAHNHNADLMKHQKEALDQIKAKMAESNATPSSPQLQQQLQGKIDQLVDSQSKAKRLEPLFTRLMAVEQASATLTLRGGFGMSNLLAAQQLAQLQAAMNPQLAAAAKAQQQAMTSARAKAKSSAKAAAKQQARAAAATAAKYGNPSVADVQAKFAQMGPAPAAVASVDRAAVKTPTKEELDAQLARVAEVAAASKIVASPAIPRSKNPSNEELQEQLARVTQAAAANATKAKNPSNEEIQAQLAKVAAATKKEGA
jgi:hypothetical protein